MAETKTESLYKTDAALWADQPAEAIAQRRWAEVDVENVAEELWGLSSSDRRELRSRLAVTALHVLKQLYQPDRASKSWEGSIFERALNRPGPR
jgi:hypothetical protein